MRLTIYRAYSDSELSALAQTAEVDHLPRAPIDLITELGARLERANDEIQMLGGRQGRPGVGEVLPGLVDDD